MPKLKFAPTSYNPHVTLTSDVIEPTYSLDDIFYEESREQEDLLVKQAEELKIWDEYESSIHDDNFY